MQTTFKLFLAFASTSYVADGLVIASKGTVATDALVVAKFNGTQLAQIGDALHHAPSAVLVRPHAGKGVDVVHFGMRAMNYFGSSLKKFTFNVDMVMTLKWKDPRVVSLVPKGLDKLSMSREQAEKAIWMPGIVVSNRDIEKYEIISSSVTIFRSGDVQRVERANTRVMKKFALKQYPFDSQNLTINICSSKYMLDEVVLKEDEGSSGVYENIWGLWTMSKWGVHVFEQTDGELVKSRGSLDIEVIRSLEKYSQDHLLPSSIALMISWAVFYFPFANPFITPRLALSILALLTFTSLIVKSSRELPGAAPFNYNDLFNQQIQTLMFVTILLNLASEIAFHTFHKEKLARCLNHEAKVLLPSLSIINIVLILGGGKYHWMELETTITLVKVVLIVLLAIYVMFALNEYVIREAEEKQENEKKEAELADPLSARSIEAAAVAAGAVAAGAVGAAVIAADGAESDVEDCDAEEVDM